MKRITGRLWGVLDGTSMPVAAWAQECPYDFWGMHPM